MTGITYKEAVDTITDYYQNQLKLSNFPDNWYEYNTGNTYQDFDFWAEGAGYHVVRGVDDKIAYIIKNESGQIVRDATDIDSNNLPSVIDNTGNFNVPVNTSYDVSTKTLKVTPITDALGNVKNFFTSDVNIGNAGFGVGVGTLLGRLTTKALYTAAPEIYNNMNPTKVDWRDYAGPVGGTALNLIMGYNPETKTMQAYAPEQLVASMALLMQQQGMFAQKQSSSHITGGTGDHSYDLSHFNISDVTYPFPYTTINNGYKFGIYDSGKSWDLECTEPVRMFTTIDDDTALVHGGKMALVLLASTAPFSVTGPPFYEHDTATRFTSVETLPPEYPDMYFMRIGWHLPSHKFAVFNPVPYGSYKINNIAEFCYVLMFGNSETISSDGFEGIKDDSNGTVVALPAFNADSATAIQDMLKAIYDALPDVKNNKITQTTAQPDGSTVTVTYMPIPIPQGLNTPNPTTGPLTQTKPYITNEEAEQEEYEPTTQPMGQLLIPSTGKTKTDVGEGDTPVVVLPTGSASALFAIYNPTQEQLNSFGSWLWSSDFVDQIKKVFYSPMDAIIGLHKIFATPTTGAEQNIKVGYLDSGVPSKIVTEQYVTIDCGSVLLQEYFGNVFDYTDTTINLYLPFIGIRQISTADAVRGLINVVYHVDVITGACLAEVRIDRDNAGGTIYQFSGSCAVQYPLSSGSYMGIVSGILSTATSVCMGLAFGGIGGGIISGMNAGARMLGGGSSANISKAGNFSGNAGAMGIKKPYIIISRPQTALATDFNKYIGKPANHTTTIGACTGFFKCREIHLEFIGATDDEMSELNTLLTTGVIA